MMFVDHLNSSPVPPSSNHVLNNALIHLKVLVNQFFLALPFGTFVAKLIELEKF